MNSDTKTYIVIAVIVAVLIWASVDQGTNGGVGGVDRIETPSP